MNDNSSKNNVYNFFRITNISLKNFHCFETFDIELNKKNRTIHYCNNDYTVAPLTVIVAKNGMGKSTILDAIKIAFAPFITYFGYKNKIKENDIHIKNNLLSNFVSIDTIGELGEKLYQWRCSIPKQKKELFTDIQNSKPILSHPFDIFTQSIKNIEQDSNPNNWPLIACYNTNRLWKKNNFSSKRNLVKNRELGYDSCLEATTNYTTAIDWMFDAVMARINEETILIKKNETLRTQLETIENALTKILEPENYIANLHIASNFKELAIIQIQEHGKVSIPISSLSDKVREVFFMVADIAFRCVKLNSHLGKLATQETEGIIMIDEIELHLHPSWQQNILDALQAIFPKIQFIVTTNSSLVTSSITSECVRTIENT